MHIKSSIGLAVGPVNESHWGQVLVLPNAYGIVEINDPEGNAQKIGVAVLSEAGEALASDLVSLKSVEEVADRVMRPHIETLLLLVPVGNVIYLVVRGRGSVYVKRKDELASLMHQDGALSGEVKSGDTFLLASYGFSSVLSHQELTGLFDRQSPMDIAEKLTILLHEKIHGEGSVALVFGVSDIFEDIQKTISEVENLEEPEPVEEIDVSVSSVAPNRGVLSGFSGIKNYALRVWDKITSRSFKEILDRFKRNPKSITGLFVFIFIFLFLLSVVLGVAKQNASKKNQRVLEAITSAQHAMDEGIALSELNPVKGRERLQEAKNTLDPFVKTVSSRTVDGRKIETLYRQITDNLTQAMQVVEAPISIFYDVSLLKKGATAAHISLSGQSLAIADTSTNTAYLLAIDSKNGQIVGGGDSVKNISVVGVYADGIYAIAEDGIMKLRLGDKKASLVVKKDESWGTISSIVAFGGNIYLLDTQKSRIWKYVATEKGFSELREYLNPDTLPDLSRTTSMAIDGSVWMGTNDGKILRFTQGKENTFVPKGVDPAFGMNLFVYTDDSAKNIYILDVANNRVVVLDKEGVYLSQYRYSVSQTPSGFVVSESEKKIILLAGGKLYGIDLK